MCPQMEPEADQWQKRLIGRKFNEKEVQNDIKHFPFKVINKVRPVLCPSKSQLLTVPIERSTPRSGRSSGRGKDLHP